MCKQDIKIGRRLTSTNTSSGPGMAAGNIVLNARADRIGVNVCMVPFSTDPRDGWSVGYQVANAIIPLVFLSYLNPSAYLSVEQYGVRVTGDIVALEQVFTAASPISFVDIFLRDNIDDVA